MLYRDLLLYVFPSLLDGDNEIPDKLDWHNAYLDNWDEPNPQHTANADLESCRAYCAQHDQCFQFTWHARHCFMSRAIRLGERKDPEGPEELGQEDRRFVSGWSGAKIKKWMEREGNDCREGPHWVKPSIERIF